MKENQTGDIVKNIMQYCEMLSVLVLGHTVCFKLYSKI